MKPSLNLPSILLIILIMTGCMNSSESKVYKRLGKMEVKIPAELKSKPEVVAYIKGMSEVANDYAMLIDNTFSEVGQYAEIKESELGVIDKIKLTKATSELAFRSAEIMGKWAEYQNKRFGLEKELSEAEIQALGIVWTDFEQRIQQIEEHYSEVFKKQ
jgi:hypothetical protein